MRAFQKHTMEVLKELKYSPRVIKYIFCQSNKPNHFPCLVKAYGKYLECVKFYFWTNQDSVTFCFDNAPVGID